MGFEEHAIKVIRGNHRLRTSRRKMLKNHGLPFINDPGVEKRGLDSHAVKRAGTKKYRSLFLWLLPLALGAVVVVGLLCRGAEDFSAAYLTDREYYLHSKKHQALLVDSLSEYNNWVQTAEGNLSLQDYDQAYRDFLAARSIRPHGKRVNIGITKILMYHCRVSDAHCELADQYLQQLMEADVLTTLELEKLRDYKSASVY